MPYDCVKLKYAWAEQSENYHNSDINRANMISAVTIIQGMINFRICISAVTEFQRRYG